MLAALALSSFVLLAQGKLALRLHGLLTRLPWVWLTTRLQPLRARFAHTDGRLRIFFSTVSSSPRTLVAFLAGWLFEALETMLILHLLGVRLPWTTLGALEVSASFTRYEWSAQRSG